MMQTQTSFTQDHLSQSVSKTINDEEYLSEEEEEYEDTYSEEDYQYPPSSEEEDETEDYPIVTYHLPTKKIDKKEEQIKNERLQERSHKIQERKQEQSKVQHQLLDFVHQDPKNFVASLKKLNKLSRPREQVKLTCYVESFNLILVLLADCKTVNVYSTTNFNLLTIKKSEKQITCISYSQHLRKILVGGHDNLLQIWSPKTLEFEAENLRKGYETFYNIEYIPKANVIVAKTASNICIYNTGLRYMTVISLPGCFGEWYTSEAEFHIISRNLLLVVSRFRRQKVPILVNLKTLKKVEYSQKICIPLNSSVQMTEKHPVNVFTCLGLWNKPAPPFISEWDSYKLLQFTINPKTEELSLIRSHDNPKNFFSKLNSLKNSKYFVAQRFDRSTEILLLSLKKEQVEVLRVISNIPMILNDITNYMMLNDESTIVEINSQRCISIYGLRKVLINNK